MVARGVVQRIVQHAVHRLRRGFVGVRIGIDDPLLFGDRELSLEKQERDLEISLKAYASLALQDLAAAVGGIHRKLAGEAAAYRTSALDAGTGARIQRYFAGDFAAGGDVLHLIGDQQGQLGLQSGADRYLRVAGHRADEKGPRKAELAGGLHDQAAAQPVDVVLLIKIALCIAHQGEVALPAEGARHSGGLRTGILRRLAVLFQRLGCVLFCLVQCSGGVDEVLDTLLVRTGL